MKRYCYSIFLVISIIILTLIEFLPGREHSVVKQQKQQPEYRSSNTPEGGETPEGKETPEAENLYDGGEPASEPVSEPASEPAPRLLQSEPLTEPSQEPVLDESGSRPEAADNFAGTLFIGDSRTVGLSEYGNLGEADVFANSGMTVFNLFDDKVKLNNGTKTGLEELLSSNHYNTIYIMLGINELGYDFPSIVKKYRSTVEKIQEIQPTATLVLEANLHVTGQKSMQSPLYNNQKINALNSEIKQIAELTGCYFINVNEIFDDSSGNLSKDFSSDGSHVFGKYYSVWVEWIRGSK